jgi:BspA type Leucine rich repeat region (6 copies)
LGEGGRELAALVFMLHSSFCLHPSRCAPQGNSIWGWTTRMTGVRTLGARQTMKVKRNLIQICLLCVMMLPAALQAQFAFITNNDAITITRYTDSNGIVTIPSMTNGYLVATIGTNAFIGCTFITNISIPNSIISIEDSAFWGCFSLTNVIIPDSVGSIGNFVFFDCINLTTITLGDKITTFGFKAFSDCYSLAGVHIPKSVTNIQDEAFWDCSSLTNVAIPAGVLWLSRSARNSGG